ncbi:MAG: class I SAM-dependent methyltransferase [Gemmataceae bacterium]|nr:class I SAM-dependent methyltransferase [Gemmataceae bacterium]
MTPPDWQLPPGVDRGLWDYLHATDMVAGYDAQMAVSPLAAADVAFCERWFPTPGRLLDLGCGTGRLCLHFAAKGYDCVGVDLSDEMLGKARATAAAAGVQIEWLKTNLVELDELPARSFDYAACLFSTLGMVRGPDNHAKVVANAFRLLKPGGRFILHAHNRYFAGLGFGRVVGQWWRTLAGRADAGDITMSQAYGGAPLTLHHFTCRQAVDLLTAAGFGVREVFPVGTDGKRARPAALAYGFLLLGERGPSGP